MYSAANIYILPIIFCLYNKQFKGERGKIITICHVIYVKVVSPTLHKILYVWWYWNPSNGQCFFAIVQSIDLLYKKNSYKLRYVNKLRPLSTATERYIIKMTLTGLKCDWSDLKWRWIVPNELEEESWASSKGDGKLHSIYYVNWCTHYTQYWLHILKCFQWLHHSYAIPISQL